MGIELSSGKGHVSPKKMVLKVKSEQSVVHEKQKVSLT